MMSIQKPNKEDVDYRRLQSSVSIMETRVQNSVFECVLDAAEFRKVKQILIDLIDPEKDSLRFYQLGNHYESKVEHIGIRPSLHVEEPLLL